MCELNEKEVSPMMQEYIADNHKKSATHSDLKISDEVSPEMKEYLQDRHKKQLKSRK